MPRFFQYASYPLVLLFSRLFVPVELRNAERLRQLSGGPLIIVANHVSAYDSFLLRLIANWRNLPIRFMGVTRFRHLDLRILKWLGVIHLTYLLFGVFKIVPGRGAEKNLEPAVRIIKKGGIVLIYPEGSINSSGTLLRFHRGAALLAQKTGAPILPIAFCFPETDTDPTVISVGERFYIEESLPIQGMTALFRETIQNLMLEARKTRSDRTATEATRAAVAGKARA